MKQNQHPGPYHTFAQKTEDIVKAIAENYIAESRKKQKEYMAILEKYEDDKKKYNKNYIVPRNSVKIINVKNWDTV